MEKQAISVGMSIKRLGKILALRVSQTCLTIGGIANNNIKTFLENRL